MNNRFVRERSLVPNWVEFVRKRIATLTKHSRASV